MGKHEYKVGDWVKFKVRYIDECGDLFPKDRGFADRDSVQPCDPPTEHSEYVGKKLSECPDGTVAVVEYTSGLQLTRQKSGNFAYGFDDGRPAKLCIASEGTVVQILKLGTTTAPVEMTVAEIEAKLGHSVKVVR